MQLDEARQALITFINQLGPSRFESVSLLPFQADFEGESMEEELGVEQLIQQADNSIRKYFDFYVRMKANRKVKSNWSREDLHILLWLIEKYSRRNVLEPKQFVFGAAMQKEGDWRQLSRMIPGKTGEQAMFKWLALKTNRCLDKRVWQEWEDAFLRSSVTYADNLPRENNARHWLKISKDLYHLQENTDKIYRTAKQCRQRWSCYVNPNIKKGHWQVQEDIILLQKYLEVGKRWSLVTKLLTGRTENAVKNRWKLLVSKYHGRKCEAAIHRFLTSLLDKLQKSLQKVEVKHEHPSEGSSSMNNLSGLTTHQAEAFGFALPIGTLAERVGGEPLHGEAEKNPQQHNIIYTGLQWPDGRLETPPPIDHFFYTEQQLQRLGYTLFE